MTCDNEICLIHVWQKCMDEKFLRLLCEKDVCCYCHGVWKPLAILSYSHSQKSFLGESFVVDRYVFKSVQKFRDEYDVCCFTFVWRRMVCVMELVETMQLQKELQDFKLNTLPTFWILNVMSSNFWCGLIIILERMPRLHYLF